jgi:hypothetical protein
MPSASGHANLKLYRHMSSISSLWQWNLDRQQDKKRRLFELQRWNLLTNDMIQCSQLWRNSCFTRPQNLITRKKAPKFIKVTLCNEWSFPTVQRMVPPPPLEMKIDCFDKQRCIEFKSKLGKFCIIHHFYRKWNENVYIFQNVCFSIQSTSDLLNKIQTFFVSVVCSCYLELFMIRDQQQLASIFEFHLHCFSMSDIS